MHAKEKALRSYCIQNTQLEIELNESVFEPSLHGLFFADNIRVNKGEKVIDVGTGTGILAILAAKKGGVTCATDTVKESIELADRNAQRNHVEVDNRMGEFFADFTTQFDVIIANLPQKMLLNSKASVEGFNGGNGGNEILLRHLEAAPRHMRESSRMYIFVYTLTDYMATLDYIINNYKARLLAYKSFKEELADINLEGYLELNERGKVNIFKIDDSWGATELFFELSLK